MLGAAVDAIEPLHEQLNGVVIGLVERVEKHPNADRLTVCQVFDGSHTIEVVCGAPNVNVGSKYPYAPVGLELPGGLKLTARSSRNARWNSVPTTRASWNSRPMRSQARSS
jgi:phenylalanyl-tRNA synthetase beta chain